MVAVEGKLSPRILGGKHRRRKTFVSSVSSYNEQRSSTNDQTRCAESFGIGIVASVPQRTTTTGIFTTTTRRHNDEGFTRRPWRKRRTKRKTDFYHEGAKSRRVFNEQRTSANERLDRLTAVTRGGAAYQSWNLDSQGNWSSSTTGGVTQTRTANAQNQITSITGTTGTPAYDSNGNMTTDQNGNKLVYDAWNRLISVSNSAGAVIAQYSYDARGHAISVTYPQGANGLPAGTTNYIYYDSQWQVLEVRTGGTAASNVTEQMVWSAAYVNAAVLQDSYYNGVLQANQRLYFLQDANWNTTAVVGFNSTAGTWGVTQRYVYSSYGSLTVLNADWSATPTGTASLVNNLYQGMALDPVTGLYNERARWYSPSLGTWISQDPLSYVNGANTYQFVMGNPITLVDPSGLAGFNFQPIPLLPQPPDLNLEEQASLNLINQQLQQINQQSQQLQQQIQQMRQQMQNPFNPYNSDVQSKDAGSTIPYPYPTSGNPAQTPSSGGPLNNKILGNILKALVGIQTSRQTGGTKNPPEVPGQFSPLIPLFSNANGSLGLGFGLNGKSPTGSVGGNINIPLTTVNGITISFDSSVSSTFTQPASDNGSFTYPAYISGLQTTVGITIGSTPSGSGGYTPSGSLNLVAFGSQPFLETGQSGQGNLGFGVSFTTRY